MKLKDLFTASERVKVELLKGKMMGAHTRLELRFYEWKLHRLYKRVKSEKQKGLR